MSEPASVTQREPLRLPNLDEIVESFEIAWNRDGQADVADFLPDSQHPQFEAIATELLCVDLERRRRRDPSVALDSYRRRFAWLASNPGLMERLAFEEYRLLRDEGTSVRPEDYAARFQIRTDHWPRADSTHVDHRTSTLVSATLPTDEADRAVTCRNPLLGDRVLDFDLVRPLGEGKFAKVFLARQASLAGRLVVLKVTTSRGCEADRLARLQHTNIVPIYSVHQRDELQIVCMPYFGQHTLDDVLRGLGDPACMTAGAFIERFVPELSSESSSDNASRTVRETLEELRALTFEQLALWIMSRIASGLAHAHDRGILHRDLKPANILLTDEGQPMILDFNLSDDLVARDNSSALIGGTLPYMAPEHLRAVAGAGSVDARSDLYAFGVILFQMLTGRLPFVSSSQSSLEALMSMAQQRMDLVPAPRSLNRQVSPAVQAIVQRCLAPDPQCRYQSARQLQEDLECQLQNRPLRHAPDRSPRERTRKWLRRHPRLTSAAALSLITTAILIVAITLLAWRSHQLAQLRALEQFRQFRQLAQSARMPLSAALDDEPWRQYGLETAEAALALFQIQHEDWQAESSYRHLPSDDRQQLDRSLQELLYLVSSSLQRQAVLHAGLTDSQTLLADALRYNQIALQLNTLHAPPAPLVDQQTELRTRLGLAGQADAEQVTSKDDRLLAIQQALEQNHEAAIPRLEQLHRDDPRDVLVAFLLGNSQCAQQQYGAAELSFTHCIALWPDAHIAYFQRGICRLKLNRPQDAERDFTEGLRQRPDQVAVHFNRAIARWQQGKLDAAIADYTAVIRLGRDDSLPFLLRSNAYRLLGQTEPAQRDLDEGLRRTPIDADGWIHRALARLPEDAEGALADLNQAVATDPTSTRALQNRAILLAEHFGRADEALRSLNQMLELDPKNHDALFMRGVLRARSQDRDAAVADARAALRLSSSALAFYQAACIFAETSRIEVGDGEVAVQLLAEALKREAPLVDQMREDADLQAIAERDDLRRLLETYASLQHAGALNFSD